MDGEDGLDKEYRVDLNMIEEVYTELSKKLFTERIKKFVEHLKQYDLSLNQYSILFLVQRGEGTTSARLGTVLRLKAASVSYLIDSLEKRGLIERTSNPDDRRSPNLRLTPAGQAVAAFPGDCADIAARFGSCSPEELEVLYLAMRLLNSKWSG